MTSETVNANTTVAVTFQTEYLLTVLVSGNGTTNPSTEWVAGGTQVSLVATANVTQPGVTPWKFESWNSSTTGVANSTQSSYPLTVNSPVTLTAVFVQAYTQQKTTNQLDGAPVAFGLLILLLVVGLAVGFLMTRRRGSVSPPSRESEAMAPAASSEMGSEGPMGTNGEAAEWAEPEAPSESGPGSP